MGDKIDWFVNEYVELKVNKAVKAAEIRMAVDCLQNDIPVDLVLEAIPSLSENLVRELQEYLG